jgi:CHAT domain-containing protein/Tfp pilus assembly protein PilF
MFSFRCFAVCAALLAVPALGGESEWRAHVDAAKAAHERRDYKDAASRFEAALREAELFGAYDPRLAVSYSNLAGMYHTLGRYQEADTLYRRSLSIFERVAGSEHPEVANTLGELANLLRTVGRFPEAEQANRRVLRIFEKAYGPDHPRIARTLNNLGAVYGTQGRYSEAEPLYRRALAMYERTLGPEDAEVGVSLNNLASLFLTQGRLVEAEPLYRRALQVYQRALGADHPRVGATLHNLGTLYRAQGRLAQARSIYLRSLVIEERAFGSDHPNLIPLLNNLAALNRAQARYSEAQTQYRRSLAISEQAFGPDQPGLGTALNGLAAVMEIEGRHAEAEPLYRRAAALYRKAFGPDHPYVGMALGNLAQLHGKQMRWDDGIAAARRMTSLFAARVAARGDIDRDSSLAEQQTRSRYFEVHVALLYGGYGGTSDAAAESFEVAQLARASDTADQVANMAARHAEGGDALARLARTRQDLTAKLLAIEARLVHAVSRSPKDRNTQAEAQLQRDAVVAQEAIAELDAQLEREFPRYRELTDPKPLETTTAQGLLKEDEALVQLLSTGEESYLWVLRPKSAGFFKLAIHRRELAGLVRLLRAQLDLGAGDPERIISQPFDVGVAHDLYRRLLGPAEPVLDGARHLIFVADGAMQSLPLGLLVTEAPVKPTLPLDALGDVAWLAKRYAVTVLPAASSLRALRQFARPPASKEPFGGFGAPLLVGDPGSTRGAGRAALYRRGAVADPNEVRKLEPLPESAVELRDMATALKAPSSAIRLGAAATERAVKEADLTRYRNLAFATHGLMAGEFRGLGEPALVLTPPVTASSVDDGLLTASEISQLKLDADWVLLSACNTAAPDGTPGAEGLSGLARAFFYAGARSLLVSHWAVSSDAAAALTTRMFDEAGEGVSKAEALRRSMLAMMRTPGRPHYAHPALWAPFVVVGDGGVRVQK